jgi:hypothetical protein
MPKPTRAQNATPEQLVPCARPSSQYIEDPAGLPFAERGFSCSDLTHCRVVLMLHTGPSAPTDVIWVPAPCVGCFPLPWSRRTTRRTLPASRVLTRYG